ncbi:helix-turn-helix transcriptional regulator [Croceibacterium aestuarii]|uniref:helix-turn-helix transcriptional regulator n=1 Tax=Croceibacterium aestuarii TaxID=3064139 RepID=UPI00272E09C4|nr:YafY family protein [Croceibacterium sp. D39]
MRRAERLFQIIQIMRGARGPVTAADLAAELEVSVRTVYRDVADLIGQRVPIRGEAGFGYVLADGFDMPPLMLTIDELEALALGAQWVMARGDEQISRSARDVMSKVHAVLPDAMRQHAFLPSVGPRPVPALAKETVDLSVLRKAVREGLALEIDYLSLAGEATTRTVRPVIVGYSETDRMLVAWCEIRADFRHFRVDRIAAARLLGPHGLGAARLRKDWTDWRTARASTR